MPIHDPVPRRALPPSGIANPHAWARYRRIMRWMLLLAAASVAVSLGAFYWQSGPMPLAMVIATSIGVFLTVMIGTGLMSLVFLSAGSGHDDDAADPFDERPR